MQMKPPNAGLQLQMQKLLHQLSSCLPSQTGQHRWKEKSILQLLLQASRIMTQMSKLAKQKSTETLGKFILSELWDIQNASNDCCVHRSIRRHKFWQTHGTWPSTQLREMPDSSQWDEVKSSLPLSLD